MLVLGVPSYTFINPKITIAEFKALPNIALINNFTIVRNIKVDCSNFNVATTFKITIKYPGAEIFNVPIIG